MIQTQIVIEQKKNVQSDVVQLIVSAGLIVRMFRTKTSKSPMVQLAPTGSYYCFGRHVSSQYEVHTLISDEFFHRLSSKLSYFSGTQVSEVILIADFNKLCLNIDIRLKNRQTGNFQKSRFFVGHDLSGYYRKLRL